MGPVTDHIHHIPPSAQFARSFVDAALSEQALSDKQSVQDRRRMGENKR